MRSKEFVQKILEEIGVQLDGSKPYDIKVHDSRFYNRVLRGGSLALGESYMDGWWDSSNLDELAEKLFTAKMNKRVKNAPIVFLRSLSAALFNLQKKVDSKKAVRHYDIDNNLYTYMLGETMAYTCAYWKNANNLDEAQLAKFDLICRKFMLKPGMKVLDLGC